jgi:hypothetical protein
MGKPAEKNDCALDHNIIAHRREQDKPSPPPLIPDKRLSTSTDCPTPKPERGELYRPRAAPPQAPLVE